MILIIIEEKEELAGQSDNAMLAEYMQQEKIHVKKWTGSHGQHFNSTIVELCRRS